MRVFERLCSTISMFECCWTVLLPIPAISPRGTSVVMCEISHNLYGFRIASTASEDDEPRRDQRGSAHMGPDPGRPYGEPTGWRHFGCASGVCGENLQIDPSETMRQEYS